MLICHTTYHITRSSAEYRFEHDKPSRFGIVPRHGDNSKIRWFESPACYVFHTLNAYEEGDEVVLIDSLSDEFYYRINA